MRQQRSNCCAAWLLLMAALPQAGRTRQPLAWGAAARGPDGPRAYTHSSALAQILCGDVPKRVSAPDLKHVSSSATETTFAKCPATVGCARAALVAS